MTALATDEARAVLERAGRQPDDRIDLAGTALALAALDRPRVRLGWYREHLDALAAGVAAEARRGPPALTEVIAGRYGYAGDTRTYDDLQNANLMRVIDRRRGLPVALGILYIHAARAQGWAAAGLSFPQHFLVRVAAGAGPAILDPFHGGHAVGPAELRALLKGIAGPAAELRPDHYAPVGDRDVLLRLQNNIKLRLLQEDRAPEAAETLGAMLTIAPEHAALWREAGIINARIGNPGAAIAALERFLALGRDERLLHEAAVLLQHLKANLH